MKSSQPSKVVVLICKACKGNIHWKLGKIHQSCEKGRKKCLVMNHVLDNESESFIIHLSDSENATDSCDNF